MERKCSLQQLLSIFCRDEHSDVFLAAQDIASGNVREYGCRDCGATLSLKPDNGLLTIEVLGESSYCSAAVAGPARRFINLVTERRKKDYITIFRSDEPERPVQLIWESRTYGMFWPKDFYGSALEDTLTRMVRAYLKSCNDFNILPGGLSRWSAEIQRFILPSSIPALSGVAVHRPTAQTAPVFTVRHMITHLDYSCHYLPPDIGRGGRISDRDLDNAHYVLDDE